MAKITPVLSIASKGEIVLYQAADGKAALDVRLECETLWLNLNQMPACLKGTSPSFPGISEISLNPVSWRAIQLLHFLQKLQPMEKPIASNILTSTLLSL